ncbi:SRPBCC family protein [Brachybacterium sp. FME24]|uniref:SRPBCC family protein n=1 Tax=Brachybacterium sp. FME24 TaxID=2742605 RepID=UPI001867F9EB|nr:SRPBCC family protein [Brachybacterium sp. FME24]
MTTHQDHQDHQEPSTFADRFIAERIVHALPDVVFDLLTDPSKHHLTEPTDWVRGSLESEPARITATGQVFGIEMFQVNAGGRYEMHNLVIAFEPGRTVAWEPAQYSANGTLEGGGWTWRYDLEPVPEGTRVRLTYDWSATPPEVAEEIGGLPSVGPEFLDRSLAALAGSVEPAAR